MTEVQQCGSSGAAAGVGTCGVCGGAASSVCGKCHAIAYCGTHCQRSDWPKHRTQCADPQKIAEDMRQAVDVLHAKIHNNLIVVAALDCAQSDIHVRVDDSPLNYLTKKTVNAVDITTVHSVGADSAATNVCVLYKFNGAEYRRTVSRLPAELIPAKYTKYPRDKWTIFVD